MCIGNSSNKCTDCFYGNYLMIKDAASSTGDCSADCPDPLVKYNTFCLSECPLTHYLNSESRLCISCANYNDLCHNCLLVNSTFTCTKCYIGYYMFNDRCLYNCPSGYSDYNSTGNCLACHSSCSSCFNTTNTSCNSCKLGYLLNNTCLTTCPSQYFIMEAEKACTLKCPNNYYIINNISCYRCHYSCQTCSLGSSSYQCDSCYAGNYLFNKQCGASCPVGYF